MDKPFIPAAENNKEAIATVLRKHFAATRRVLEIGAGTGQHAVHCAQTLPHLVWQTSDLASMIAGIERWVAEAALANLPAPQVLDVRDGPWPESGYDAVFSSNTAHFMAWSAVQAMFAGVARVLESGGSFALYGPFNYGGRYVSDGNRRLDAWLAAHHPDLAIRDFEAVAGLAASAGLELCEDCAMPANNRLLIWRR